MTLEPVAADGYRFRHPMRFVQGWKLWELPAKALLLVLGVEFVTVVATVRAIADSSWSGLHFGRFLLMLMLGIAYFELTYQLHRMRSSFGRDKLVELNSVWTFAAVILLPLGYTIGLVIGLFAFAGLRRRQQRGTPHRLAYSAAVLVLTAVAAHAVAVRLNPGLAALPSGPSAAGAIAASAAVFIVLNVALVATVIFLAAGPMPLRDLIPARDELGLEVATLVLGVLTAEMIHDQVWLTPAVLILMLLLQRSSLVAQLQVAATTDTKTGLLNATAWQELAQRELLRAQRDSSPCAVMLLDLDHFKQVNDTVGHISGDHALKAVAEALNRELRGYDAVARFGGEEFVVFLNDLTLLDARQVAERTLSRIRAVTVSGKKPGGPQVSLTASIGLAAYPDHGSDLTDLLEAADSALYAAKRSGRDQVSEPPWGIDERVNR